MLSIFCALPLVLTLQTIPVIQLSLIVRTLPLRSAELMMAAASPPPLVGMAAPPPQAAPPPAAGTAAAPPPPAAGTAAAPPPQAASPPAAGSVAASTARVDRHGNSSSSEEESETPEMNAEQEIAVRKRTPTATNLVPSLRKTSFAVDKKNESIATSTQYASDRLREKLKSLAILPTMIDRIIKNAHDLASTRNVIADMKSIIETLKPEEKFPRSLKLKTTLQVKDIAKNEQEIQALTYEWEANTLSYQKKQKDIILKVKTVEIGLLMKQLREQLIFALYEIAYNLTIQESNKLKVVLEGTSDLPDLSKPLLSSIAFCSVLVTLANAGTKPKLEAYAQVPVPDLIKELTALAPKIDPNPPTFTSIHDLADIDNEYKGMVCTISTMVVKCLPSISSDYQIDIGLYKADLISSAQIAARLQGTLKRSATEATQAAIDKEPHRQASSLKCHIDLVVDERVSESKKAKKAKGGQRPKSNPMTDSPQEEAGKGNATVASKQSSKKRKKKSKKDPKKMEEEPARSTDKSSGSQQQKKKKRPKGNRQGGANKDGKGKAKRGG